MQILESLLLVETSGATCGHYEILVLLEKWCSGRSTGRARSDVLDVR